MISRRYRLSGDRDLEPEHDDYELAQRDYEDASERISGDVRAGFDYDEELMSEWQRLRYGGFPTGERWWFV